jgi:rRNA maturation protein Nop10
MEAAAAKVIPLSDVDKKFPRGRRLGLVRPPGGGSTKENTPPRVSMDLIDRFGEARMELEAFLEGIYNTALQINNSDSIITFCSMAKDRVKVMDEVFAEITGEKEEE